MNKYKPLHLWMEAARTHSQVSENWLQNPPNHTSLSIDLCPSFFVRPLQARQFADSIDDPLKTPLDALPFCLKRLAGLVNHRLYDVTATTPMLQTKIFYLLYRVIRQFPLAQQLNQL
ncbi:MAG: hypothetical protein IPI79_08840 [Moraxellaceae bacterium]|nr:hypothetical protein [Moraxellaceae bacterium]